jgi:hypothetical protein
MKDTVTEYQFSDEMIKYGFSYEGTKALFEYFDEYERDCDMEIEFDPIGIRCDFNEYKNLKEIKESYQDIETLEDLKDRTIVIEVPKTDRLIIQVF